MIYICPFWVYAADAHLWKEQPMQNKVIHAFGELEKRPPFREIKLAINISSM
jgi:hypothetical protein